MFSPTRIHLLSQLALKSYHDAIRPDSFAVIAAHTLAVDAAAFHDRASADAAGFVAISSMLNISRYGAELASLSTEMQDLMKRNQANTGNQQTLSKTIGPAFQALTKNLKNVHFDEDVRALYHSNFETTTSEKPRLALNAACSTYPHAYATSRAAYTHAVAMAALVPEGKKRDTLFISTINKRLTADLLHQPVSSNFLMSCFCSPLMKYLALLLLFAGFAALTVGIGGFLLPSMGAFIINTLSTTCAAITTIGGITGVASIGLFGTKHYLKKQREQNNERSREAVDAFNSDERNLSPTAKN